MIVVEPPASLTACAMHTVRDDTTAPPFQEGEVHAGPIWIGERSGRVTCAVKPATSGHADPAMAARTSATTPGAVALPPTLVSFPDMPVVLCSSVEIDGVGTYYWDGVSHRWSASADVSC